MIIKDEGYVLSAKQYGEKALIVTLLTKSKGKIAKGRGRKTAGCFSRGTSCFLRRRRGWRRICGGCYFVLSKISFDSFYFYYMI
ncbi:MAG: hypothetical protein BHW56_01705 [Acetobacter sp. 46_36]|nr:MAG: hypothetical protein BHW56_01705 [Acetobacter sp. 46_36]